MLKKGISPKLLLIYFIGYLLVGGISIQAQSDSGSSRNFLDIGSSYTSNYNAFGTTNATQKQPSLSFIANYTYNNGLFSSLNHSIVFNSDTTMSEATSETDLTVGYNWNFLPGLSVVGSYSHYYFANKASTLNTGNTGDFQLNLSLDTTLLYASISSSYILGSSDNTLNLSAKLGMPIDFNITDDISVIIQPTAEISWGNQTYYNEWALKQYKFLIPFAKVLPDYNAHDLLNPIKNTDSKEVKVYKALVKRTANWMKKINKLEANTTVGQLFESHNEYNINTLGYSVPVYVSYKSFMFNFSFTALKPQNTPSWVNNDWVYIYNAGLTYSIDW